MSYTHRHLDNQLKKENQLENVLSINDRMNQENLNKFKYFVEDFKKEDRTEEDKIEKVNHISFNQESISESSSINTQAEAFEEDRNNKIFCKSEKNSSSFHVSTSQNKIKEERIMQPSQIGEVAIGEINYGKDDGTTRLKEVINEAAPIATRKFSANVNSDKVIRKSLENDTVKADTRKLKTVTLDRVGRIFKSRGQTCEVDKTEMDLDDRTNTTAKSNENCDEESSRKDKTNSLGRMLKLVDKDGTPKKLFPHSRAGSLSRIFRKHSINEINETTDEPKEESPGLFSRMFNHLRGRSASSRNKGNSSNSGETIEKGKVSLPPTVPSKVSSVKSSKPPLPISLPSSSSSSTEKQQATRSSRRTSNLA